MPELPDITIYIEALERRILGRPLQNVRLKSPFLLRSVDPPLTAVRALPVRRLRRVGKRIAIGLAGDLWLVLHLMIHGRLHWKEPHTKLTGRYDRRLRFPERHAHAHRVRPEEARGLARAAGRGCPVGP